jgi:ribonuclease P protein component
MLAQSPGTRVSFPYGSMKLIGGPPRGAVVISKKVAKTAPVRNRIRRRVYAILRGAFKTGEGSGSIIVYPNKDALSAPFQELERSILFALSSRRRGN